MWQSRPNAVRVSVLFVICILPFSTFPVQAEPQTEIAKLTVSWKPDADRYNDWFGTSVAISGNTLVSGSFSDECADGIDCGSAYVFELDGLLWSQRAKLTASDALASDRFGVVSISSTTIAVGAYSADCIDGQDCGSLYIFEKPGGVWQDMTETVRLTASDAKADDRFGLSISISGNVVVVGSYLDDYPSCINCGSAYVFEKVDGKWTQVAKLTASDAAGGESFGASVSISGTTIAVGAWADEGSGSAYVFEKPGGGWVNMSQTTKLMPTDGAANDLFGAAIAIDGDTIVVGAYGDECSISGSDCGSAYVFTKPGISWCVNPPCLPDSPLAQSAKLVAPNQSVPPGEFHQFGYSVAISGGTAVVGSNLTNCGAEEDCGVAYAFTRPASGWIDPSESNILAASDAAAGDHFGHSVACFDGTVLVGALFDDCGAGTDCGAVYVYEVKPIYVRADAVGADDGSSWADAYDNLQDALISARPASMRLGGNPPTEIWVAKGTYHPDQGGGQTPGDRTATFQLLDGVAIYGGFNGTETLRSQRDIAANPTILSGDLLGNDAEVGCTVDGECAALGSKCIAGYCIMLQNNAENSYHIVTGSATDDTAVLDGFSITAGNANGSLPHVHGAGLYNDSGSPTVSNCTFSRNWVVGGGGSGMVNLSNSNPVVTNCTFIRNSGISASGAGILNSLSNPQVTNCRFLSNYAGDGGGITNAASSPSVTNCLFNGNMAGSGGGMNNQSSSNPTLTNCTLTGNQAILKGGGIYNLNNSNPIIVSSSFMDNGAGDGGGITSDASNPTLINCVFGRNTAANGGGIHNLNSSPSLVNCRFGGNIATLSGGAVFLNDSPATITNCTLHANAAGDFGGGVYVQWSPPTITNSVLWGNEDSTGMTSGAQIKNATFGFPTHYNIVQGGYTGSGSTNNINADPLFFDPDGVDGIVGTLDDNLRLRDGSPAIDSGSNAALPTDLFDLDGDLNTAEPIPFDLAGSPRVIDSTVDRGAYEYFPDCNNNGVDDAVDISGNTSQDCTGVNDCCETHLTGGCSDPGVESCVCKIDSNCCSEEWDTSCVDLASNSCGGCGANGIPDECDIAACAGNPACDDCNLNGVPDACDISSAFSLDTSPADEIPDECQSFTDTCTLPGEEQNWTCPDNWNLGGNYPDDQDSAPGVSVTLPNGSIAFLNDTVVIPSLRLEEGSQVNITQTGAQGDLIFSTPAILNIEGTMLVSGARAIGGAPGLSPEVTVRPEGVYEADPVAVAGGAVTATLTASDMSIVGSDCFIPPCPHGGEMNLSDAMTVTTQGDFLIDGSLANGECHLHRDGQAAVLSFHTPPSIRVIGSASIIVTSVFSMQGAAGVLLESSQPATIGGDWENHSVRPDCFDAATGIVRLNGASQTFEVAATDTGGNGFSADNFRIGTLEIAGGSTVTVLDDFDNDLQSQASCGEAQYVDTLILEAGASLIAQNCRVYYNTLIQDPSASIALLGCGEVRAADNPNPVAPDASGLSKSRAISFTPPSPAMASMGSAEQSALRVRLVSLHHVVPPYSGGPSIPFTSFEGQIRWVGPPTQYVESASSGVPLMAASLQCSPYYHEWSTVGLLHVFSNAIVPSSEYSVQSLAGSCAGIEERCTAISAPLTINTTRWGDVENPFNPPSTTVQPDVTDIGALVNKFRSAVGAPIKARGLLAGAPGNAFGEITPAVLGVDFGFSHISACVDAFRGVPYPYTIQTCP